MDQKQRAANYRARAAEIRNIIDTIDDATARATLQNLAADYERAASDIEDRHRINCTLATPEEAARRVVLLFIETFRRRAGEAIRLQVLQATFLSDGWTLNEFYDGLFFAGGQGWLEFHNGEGKLTDGGFNAATPP